MKPLDDEIKIGLRNNAMHFEKYQHFFGMIYILI